LTLGIAAVKIRRPGAGGCRLGVGEAMADDQLRIHEHPLLAVADSPATVRIIVDGRAIAARAGEPIAAALWANGIRVMRTMPGSGSARGYFCGIGRCGSCLMRVDGGPAPTCVTPVRDGMVIEVLHGIGEAEWTG
jgi:ferredoxin